MIRTVNKNGILVIVDGAAFGPEISKLLRYLEISGKECVIFAPESFEYITRNNMSTCSTTVGGEYHNTLKGTMQAVS